MRARRLQQALVLVGGQARRAVLPEARGERGRVAAQRRVAPERRAVAREIVARDERIAVRQERTDVGGDPLAVAAAADVGGARGRQARRVDDRRVGPRRQVKRVAARRVGVGARVLARPGRGRPRRRSPARRPSVWNAPVAGSRPGLGATLWQKTQLSFQRVTWRSNTPPAVARPRGVVDGRVDPENRNAPVIGNQRFSSMWYATGNRHSVSPSRGQVLLVAARPDGAHDLRRARRRARASRRSSGSRRPRRDPCAPRRPRGAASRPRSRRGCSPASPRSSSCDGTCATSSRNGPGDSGGRRASPRSRRREGRARVAEIRRPARAASPRPPAAPAATRWPAPGRRNAAAHARILRERHVIPAPIRSSSAPTSSLTSVPVVLRFVG